MGYDLKKLKMLAQGGEAEIYDIGDGKVLRVIRVAGRKPIDTEKILYPLLREYQINVPEIYDYPEVDGRPAQIMQNISGDNMLDFIGHHPLNMMKLVKELAGIHNGILNIETDADITTISDRMDYIRSKPLMLEKQLADFAIKSFLELPEKNNICHGDFHPGNILMQNGKCYIIDWSGAYKGDTLSDIAHTYLLMKLVPKIPGQSKVRYAVISYVGSYMAKAYLKEMSRQKGFDFAAFSKWTVVMSFSRIYFGQPSEKQGRIDYIRKCYELNSQSSDATLWYKNV